MIDPQSDMISNEKTVSHNLKQFMLCRECIKHCYQQLNRDFKGIRDAVLEVKNTPKTMKRIALVC